MKLCIGFTLVEIVISVGIMLIIVGSLGGFVVSLQSARQHMASAQEVDGNFRIALDLLGSRIRGARGVNAGASIFDTDPGVLSLEMANPALNPTVFRLDQDNGILQMQEGAGSPVSVTSNEVRVSDLVFSLRSPAGEPENVGIALTIDYYSQTDSYAGFSHSLTTAVTARE
ncbi:hypothetical protein HY623_01425 [Candidatus Uhrbacteria bacterium]|nr:hypothetical protein [Candidatus Uhrbacteria bacterium]